jgi:hypothetical protein
MKRIAFFALAAVAASFLIATEQPALAQSSLTGDCAPTGLGYRSVDASAATTAMFSYDDVPATSRVFRQAGSQASCVVITFSSQAFTSANEYLRVQAMVDAAVCTPDESIFVFNQQFVASYTMTYVCPSVAPGRHTAKMTFRTDGGSSVTLGNRTMTVRYAK